MNDSRIANLLLKSESSEVLDSLWVPNSSPSFHGSASMVQLEDENTSEKPFFTRIDTKSENCNDEFDLCFHQPEKKRRLSHDQVHFLEKSFEVENKLEPERKLQLAKELGLQPRQVAIWFQNRRARYKTKVLEKEYGSLKASYDQLKLDYDTLLKQTDKMKNEVKLLTEKLVMREKEAVKVESGVVGAMDCKAASSAKSDVFDSDTDGNHSSNVSDFSQDEDDGLIMGCFPKLEMEGCDDLQPNSCNLGFPVQDQGTWFWQY